MRRRMNRSQRSPEMDDGWPTPVTKRVAWRSTSRDSRLARGNGRCRPRVERLPAGVRTERSSSSSIPRGFWWQSGSPPESVPHWMLRRFYSPISTMNWAERCCSRSGTGSVVRLAGQSIQQDRGLLGGLDKARKVDSLVHRVTAPAHGTHSCQARPHITGNK